MVGTNSIGFFLVGGARKPTVREDYCWAAPGRAAAAHVQRGLADAAENPIRGAEVPQSVRLRLPPGGGCRSALPEILILTVAKSPEKHSSLLAAAWRSCGAARAAEEKKRERLGICSSGCCKTSASNLAPASASQPSGCPSMCC